MQGQQVHEGAQRPRQPRQLIGLLERSGFPVELTPDLNQAPAIHEPSLGAGLRVAGS